MAEPFNPYHIWLGIPPDEQPANHYRVLGVPLFEASAEVIDGAADRQMAHLRTFQSSKNGKLAEQLLNEVAAARVCLLDPKKREAYDQKLRAAQSAKMAAASGIGTASTAAGGSAIQRQPPRRATAGAPTTMPTAAPLNVPGAAVGPQAADSWNEMLGDPNAKAVSRPGSNSAKAAAAKRSANNRMMPLAIVGGLVLAAVVGFVVLSSGGTSEGTLVFDWPAADRANTTVKVDDTPLTIPASGSWEFSCPPGSHHIVADHLAYNLDAKVDVAAGQKQTVAPDWKAKATLVLNWPLAMRSGAELRIDGHIQTVSPRELLEVAIEPGRHQILITRTGFDPIRTTATVAADARELVSIAAPPTTAKLAFDWPARDRKDAELTVDGQSQTVANDSASASFELTLPPGRHVVHIDRAGYEPFKQAIDLAAGDNTSIKPTWTPRQKAAPTVVATQTPVETVAQPVKKLAVPPAAEQERIAKQLESLYKISKPDAKDAAKAQEIYDVAAKNGNTPAERYMLLLKGAEVAAAAGDLNLSLSGIDSLDADFEINALDLKQKLVEKFISAGKPDQVAIAIPAAEQLVDQAVAADQYEIALVLATAASRAVAKSKIATHKEVEDRLSRRRRDIHLIEPLYAAAKKAQEMLAKNPADAEANLTVGRWRCLYKGDWTNGLPLLAKSSDDKLKSLAAEELKASTDAEEQAHLADAWWDLAANEPQLARNAPRLHAAGIYQVVLPKVASILKKAQIEGRLKEVAPLMPAAAPIAAASHGQPQYTTNEFSWQLGSPGMELVPQQKGFCILSAMSGHFEGYGEGAGVHVSDAGFWSLEGHCNQSFLAAKAISIEGLTPSLFKSTVKEYQWRNGDPPVKMLHKSQGICFLSAVEGRFHGWGEEVAVRLRDDGYWYLEGRARQNELGASAIAIEWAKPGAPPVDIEERTWSRGDSPVKLVDKAAGFAVLSAVSGFFNGNGEEVRLNVGDDGQWSLDGKAVQNDMLATATIIRWSRAAGHPALADRSPEPAAAAGFPLNQWVDLLPLIDPTANEVEGRWFRQGAELCCLSNFYARIEAPVAVDGEYDLETEFTRTEGVDDANTIIPVGAEQCDVVLSGWHGTASGLAQVDGLLPNREENPATVRPGELENGHRYKVLISVRRPKPDRVTVDVSLDGKPYFPHWEGNVRSLSLNGDWCMPHSRRPALATCLTQVTYHAMRLRMISGRAALDSGAAEPPAGAKRTTIVSARWGQDGNWADVTRVVEQAVARGEVVYATTGFLKSDPASGVAKQLQITYKVGGTEKSANVNEHGNWSKYDYEMK